VAVISCLTTVWFDFGAVDRLGEALDQLAIRRPPTSSGRPTKEATGGRAGR
jgi:hypothetical protein